MIALIDGDILLYEIGFAAEANWKHMKAQTHPEYEGPFIPPFEVAEEILDRRIGNIMGVTGATSAIFFFTGKSNFRYSIARRKPYKERAGNKPFHYYNLKAYIKGKYEYREIEGLEADDLLAIEQASRGYSEETIICSRDKDVAQVRGWFYSWELGQQAQFGPINIQGYGSLEVSEDGKKIRGTGDKFFLFQCLTGDGVDTVPGLPKCGRVKALKILQATQTYEEGLEAVREAYRAFYGGVLNGDAELVEQARLLWMIRELNEDGSPKIWEMF